MITTQQSQGARGAAMKKGAYFRLPADMIVAMRRESMQTGVSQAQQIEVAWQAHYGPFDQKCPTCNGWGTVEIMCLRCNGTGFVGSEVCCGGFDEATCPECGGSGEKNI